MKKVIIGISIFFCLVILTFVGITAFSRINSITFTGDDYYSQAQLQEMIFYDEASYSPLVTFLRNLTGDTAEIPFVKDYSVSFNSLSSVTVNVEAEEMMGYVCFMDTNLYFDRDGNVVESSAEVYPDIPQVSGLDIDYVVLGTQLPVSSKTVLNKLLQVSQFLCEKSVSWNGTESRLINVVDRIHFDTGNQILLYMDEIVINMGVGYKLEATLSEFADIIPNLEGRCGTLHLETYDSSKEVQTYSFY